MNHNSLTKALRVLAALVALTLGCVANETGETRADAGAVVNGPLGQALDAHLTAQEKLGLHGTALVAKGNDVLLHKGYGFANRQKQRRNTTETIFDIGSITKQFTATAIMKLESEGKLSTEDRLSKHFANVPPDKSAITLHHLLNHTSGFDDAYGEDTEIAPRDETVRLIMSKPLLSTPGIQYRYSNPGYSLLAAIVEVRSGQPWERYLAETFFKPAGMTKTGYRLPSWNLADMSHNYNEDVDKGAPYERSWGPEGPYWHLFGNGGILMTTGDMFRWVKALDGERALPDALKKKMWTKYVQTTSESEAYYGYGWQIRKTDRGTTVVSHGGGSSFGVSAALHLFVDDDVVVILFSNSLPVPNNARYGQVTALWRIASRGPNS
jgi:CubicO group peptidase (beta-lactamase class C family)